MVYEEHCCFSDFCWPPVDFEAVELINGDYLVEGDVKGSVCFPSASVFFGKDVCFDFTQFCVCKVEEVTGSAGWVTVNVGGKFLEELGEIGVLGCGVPYETVCFCSVLVEEEWTDGFEDVFLSGVVFAGCMAGLFRLHHLEEGTEN